MQCEPGASTGWHELKRDFYELPGAADLLIPGPGKTQPAILFILPDLSAGCHDRAVRMDHGNCQLTAHTGIHF